METQILCVIDAQNGTVAEGSQTAIPTPKRGLHQRTSVRMRSSSVLMVKIRVPNSGGMLGSS